MTTVAAQTGLCELLRITAVFYSHFRNHQKMKKKNVCTSFFSGHRNVMKAKQKQQITTISIWPPCNLKHLILNLLSAYNLLKHSGHL